MNKTLNDLTAEEKLRLICGKDCWHTCDFDGKLPFIRVTDASMGVRMPVDPEQWSSGDKPSVSYPSMQMLANTWNLEIVKTYAECVADDCLDYGADILLGPGVNIKRSPLIFRKTLILRVRSQNNTLRLCKAKVRARASSIFAAIISSTIACSSRARWTNGRCAKSITDRLKLPVRQSP